LHAENEIKFQWKAASQWHSVNEKIHQSPVII